VKTENIPNPCAKPPKTDKISSHTGAIPQRNSKSVSMLHPNACLSDRRILSTAPLSVRRGQMFESLDIAIKHKRDIERATKLNARSRQPIADRRALNGA